VHILDLGCGTGKEALGLLTISAEIHLVAVDKSERMLDTFHAKVRRTLGERRLKEVVSFTLADFSTDGWINLLVGTGEHDPQLPYFDIVVAAHSLHHLTCNQKAQLYASIAAIIRPGGLFAILDLFDFDQMWLANLSNKTLISWLDSQMADNSAAADNAGLFPISLRRKLAASWRDHIRHENRPLPLWASSSGESTNEATLLRAAGFTAMEVPFRWFQGGLVLCQKACGR
jgi:SAM-dependent methyltransferase